MNHYLPLIARILLSVIFLRSGFSKIFNFAATQEFMASKDIPLTGLMLVATIIVLLLGGFFVLLGYQARLGAWLLIGFLIPATLIFHTDFPAEESAFLKNIGLIGGLLMVTAFGPGEIAIESAKKPESS